jgi:isoleucyl-tRNA synthetase
VVEAYRKIRNTSRILAANLYDFDPARDRVPLERLEPVDRYALTRYAEAANKVLRAYDDYDFQVVFHAINALVTVELSAFYVDVSKDRLYTLAAGSPSRRAAQTTMYVIVDGLVRLLAPILPVTAEQLWKVLPGTRELSVHEALFPDAAELARLQDAAPVADWERLLDLRAEVNAAIEEQRKARVIGNSLMAGVTIEASAADLPLLEKYAGSLATLFIVSAVELVPAAATRVAVKRVDGAKCERCWRYVTAVSAEAAREGLCERCIEALADSVRS